MILESYSIYSVTKQPGIERYRCMFYHCLYKKIHTKILHAYAYDPDHKNQLTITACVQKL